MKEKAVAEEQMRQQLEEQLREREELLRSQMQQQLALLAAEKSQVEERLQQEMEKAVQEKDRELQDRLKGEMDRLQKVGITWPVGRWDMVTVTGSPLSEQLELVVMKWGRLLV